jgi:hypothetical protein
MAPGSDERQIGIMPNGHSTYTEKNNAKYLRTIRKYSSIIQGQFFGHLHSDSFRIVYNDMGKTFLLHFNSLLSSSLLLALSLSLSHSLLPHFSSNVELKEIVGEMKIYLTQFTCLILFNFSKWRNGKRNGKVKRLKDIFFICQLFNPKNE